MVHSQIRHGQRVVAGERILLEDVGDESGNMRALAVTSGQRWPTMPNVPTMAEAGVKDFVVTSWAAYVMPAATPRVIVDRLSAAQKEFANDAALQKRFLEAGGRLLFSTPEEAKAFAAKEATWWQEVVKLAGLKPHEVCARGVGRTWQVVRSFPRMTVLENLCLAQKVVRKTPKAEREERARAQALSEGASQRIDELRTRIQDELECTPADLAALANAKDIPVTGTLNASAQVNGTVAAPRVAPLADVLRDLRSLLDTGLMADGGVGRMGLPLEAEGRGKPPVVFLYADTPDTEMLPLMFCGE